MQQVVRPQEQECSRQYSRASPVPCCPPPDQVSLGRWCSSETTLPLAHDLSGLPPHEAAGPSPTHQLQSLLLLDQGLGTLFCLSLTPAPLCSLSVYLPSYPCPSSHLQALMALDPGLAPYCQCPFLPRRRCWGWTQVLRPSATLSPHTGAAVGLDPGLQTLSFPSCRPYWHWTQVLRPSAAPLNGHTSACSCSTWRHPACWRVSQPTLNHRH